MSDRRTDRLVLALRERILRGEFAPGERLTELGLAPLLGGSRTPVRLALERLAHEGLVEAVPSGGFRLRSFSIAEIWDQIEIRGVLEGTAARLAAERLDNPHELRRLRELAQDPPLDSPITEEDFSAYLERNEEFHRELWRLAKSAPLVRALEAVSKLPFAGPAALVYSEADRDGTTYAAQVAAEHHRALAEAIEAREGARAEALAREHSRLSRRNLEIALQSSEARKRVPGAALIHRPSKTN